MVQLGMVLNDPLKKSVLQAAGCVFPKDFDAGTVLVWSISTSCLPELSQIF